MATGNVVYGNFGGDEALTNARAMNKEVGVNANRERRL